MLFHYLNIFIAFVVIEHEILVTVEDKFRTAKLLETHEYHEVGKRIVSALLVSKELSRTAFEKFFNKPEQANEVLGTNVFAYHPEKNTVTFQSRSIEYYIRENASIFIR